MKNIQNTFDYHCIFTYLCKNYKLESVLEIYQGKRVTELYAKKVYCTYFLLYRNSAFTGWDIL